MKNDSYYMDLYYELRDDYNHLKSEKLELMAEVERLRKGSFVTAVPVEEYERLKKDNEELQNRCDFLEGRNKE